METGPEAFGFSKPPNPGPVGLLLVETFSVRTFPCLRCRRDPMFSRTHSSTYKLVSFSSNLLGIITRGWLLTGKYLHKSQTNNTRVRVGRAKAR